MTTATALLACPIRLAKAALPASAVTAMKQTSWRVGTSEGLDAAVFFDALSGTPLYKERYKDDVAAFAPRLPANVRNDIPLLWQEAADAKFGLLGPNLVLILSVA